MKSEGGSRFARCPRVWVIQPCRKGRMVCLLRDLGPQSVPLIQDFALVLGQVRHVAVRPDDLGGRLEPRVFRHLVAGVGVAQGALLVSRQRSLAFSGADEVDDYSNCIILH